MRMQDQQDIVINKLEPLIHLKMNVPLLQGEARTGEILNLVWKMTSPKSSPKKERAYVIVS